MVTTVSVTGTRVGATEAQLAALHKVLSEQFAPGAIFRHGDCVGVDSQAAQMAYTIGYRVIAHPGPDDSHFRANAPSHEVLPCQAFFARNRAMVDAADVLVVVPVSDCWQSRGGTWYTHDYAVKKKRPVIVIWPDGTAQYQPASHSLTCHV